MSGLQQLIENQNNENIQLKRKNCILEIENIKLMGQTKKLLKHFYFKLILFIFKGI